MRTVCQLTALPTEYKEIIYTDTDDMGRLAHYNG